MKPLTLITLLFPTLVSAQIVTGTGQALVKHHGNITNTCAVAETRALKNALLDKMGTEFEATKSNYCYELKENIYCNHYRDLTHNVSGTIKRVLDKRESIWNGVCVVTVKAEVEKSKPLGARVSGKNIYHVGDKMWYDVEVNEQFYLYVFNVYDGKVDLIFPLNYNNDNLIDKDYVFPGNGMKYIAYIASGESISEETVLFLFTKHEILFNTTMLTEEVLNDIITEIPVHSRRLVKFNILIKEP